MENKDSLPGHKGPGTISFNPKKGKTLTALGIDLRRYYQIISSATPVGAYEVSLATDRHPKQGNPRIPVKHQGQVFMLGIHRETKRRVFNCPSCGTFHEVLYKPHPKDPLRGSEGLKCRVCHGYKDQPLYRASGSNADRDEAHAALLERRDVELSIQDILADKVTSRHRELPTLLSRMEDLTKYLANSDAYKVYVVCINNCRIIN